MMKGAIRFQDHQSAVVAVGYEQVAFVVAVAKNRHGQFTNLAAMSSVDLDQRAIGGVLLNHMTTSLGDKDVTGRYYDCVCESVRGVVAM